MVMMVIIIVITFVADESVQRRCCARLELFDATSLVCESLGLNLSCPPACPSDLRQLGEEPKIGFPEQFLQLVECAQIAGNPAG